MKRITLAFVLSAVALACGGQEVKHPYQADDKTPANSSSESRLNGEDPNKPKSTTPTSASSASDPTQPVVSSVADMPKSSDSDSANANGGKGGDKGDKGDKTASKDSGKGPKPSKSGPKASKAECDKALEKALELEIASRPEFADVDKGELIKMAKQMAAQQHGQAPCDASKAQYNCAMASKSTAEWKRCME